MEFLRKAMLPVGVMLAGATLHIIFFNRPQRSFHFR